MQQFEQQRGKRPETHAKSCRDYLQQHVEDTKEGLRLSTRFINPQITWNFIISNNKNKLTLHYIDEVLNS